MTHTISCFRYLFGLLMVCWGCGADHHNAGNDSSRPYPSADNIEHPGRVEANIHCSSCHAVPEPGLLDRKTWQESVLPNMGARMGIRTPGKDPFAAVADDEIDLVQQLNIYPNESIISSEEWQDIVDYYSQAAPEELPVPDLTKYTISSEPPPFAPHLLEIGDSKMPKVSLLEYDHEHSILYIGDHLNLYALDTQGSVVSSWKINTPAVDIFFGEQTVYLLTIGEFGPSDKTSGVFFPLLSGNSEVAKQHIITGLRRPVHFSIGDLNGDNREDIVISEFGNYQGELAFYDSFQPGKKHLLNALPGARKSEIRDMNGDGRPDIVALIAQSWESLRIYYQEEDGTFLEETILQFPAVYGVSYFEMADFNEDGWLDILLTNGDNWDYSPIRKPYHGIRIFLNDGSGDFTERYFYPMSGCSQAAAHDFDQDGDLDLVAISFYNVHLDHANQSFVYLENGGNLDFTGYYMNESSCGRWLTMDIGDFNGDGYTDVFLGSYFHNLSELSRQVYQEVEAFPQVLLLTFRKPG